MRRAPPPTLLVRGACGSPGHEAAPWLTRLPTPFRFVQRQKKAPRAPLPPEADRAACRCGRTLRQAPCPGVGAVPSRTPKLEECVWDQGRGGATWPQSGGEPCARQAWGFGTVARRHPGSLFPSSHVPVVSARVLEPAPQQWPLLSPPVALSAPQGLCWVPFPSRKPVSGRPRPPCSRAQLRSAHAFARARVHTRSHALTPPLKHSRTPVWQWLCLPLPRALAVSCPSVPTPSRVHGAVALVMSASVPAAHLGLCPPPTPVVLRTPWHIVEE